MQEIGSGFFVLLGALVGAFASISTVAIQAYITDRREKADRDRERIERMYRLMKQVLECVEVTQNVADQWRLRMPEPDGTQGQASKASLRFDECVRLVSELATLQHLYFPALAPWHRKTALLVAAHGQLCNQLVYDVSETRVTKTRERHELSCQKYEEFLAAWRAYLDELRRMIKS